MIVLTEAPPTDTDLSRFYAQLPKEGMVFSSSMCGESYEPATTFDDSWSCPAIAWSSGGCETYLFESGSAIELRITGAMTIAAGDRYAYRAGHTPVQSNMIVFPRSVTELPAYRDITLQTRLIRSDRETETLLRSIAHGCRTKSRERNWFLARVIELYGRLAETQKEIDRASRSVAAQKTKTQEYLTARADRAQQFILESFHDPSLSVARIARVACLSPCHLIRTFKAVTGQSPMQYLQATRMTAALRLLLESELPVAEIAQSVGYTNRTAFARRFRRRYGMSPSDVRDS